MRHSLSGLDDAVLKMVVKPARARFERHHIVAARTALPLDEFLERALDRETLAKKSTRLAGMTIVISGVFSHHSRDEYKAMIEANGGKNSGSISSKTSYVLAGDNMGPAKLEKARNLGITIINEDQFLEMIEKE